MSDHDGTDVESKDVADVTVVMYYRSSELETYDVLSTEEGVTLVDITQTLGWIFPGADSTLDKVVIDGSIFEGDAIQQTTMDATGVKPHSVVQVYKTMLASDDDSDN